MGAKMVFTRNKEERNNTNTQVQNSNTQNKTANAYKALEQRINKCYLNSINLPEAPRREKKEIMGDIKDYLENLNGVKDLMGRKSETVVGSYKKLLHNVKAIENFEMNYGAKYQEKLNDYEHKEEYNKAIMIAKNNECIEALRKIKMYGDGGKSFLMDRMEKAFERQMGGKSDATDLLVGLTVLSELTDKQIEIINDFADICVDEENKLKVNEIIEKATKSLNDSPAGKK